MGAQGSIKKQIRSRGEEIIDDAENLIGKLKDLESFAKEKKHPYMHFHSFKNDLQAFVDQFGRMLR